MNRVSVRFNYKVLHNLIEHSHDLEFFLMYVEKT